MALNKKIRKKVWCTTEPKNINSCWAKSGTNKEIKKNLNVPPRVVCPDCKKRFKPRIRECNDVGCWHIYLPAHKKEV